MITGDSPTALMHASVLDDGARGLICNIFRDGYRIVDARGDVIEVDDERLSKVIGESHRLFGIISSEAVALRALNMMRSVVSQMETDNPELYADPAKKTAEKIALVDTALIYIISFMNNPSDTNKKEFTSQEIIEACASIGIEDTAVIQFAVYKGLDIGAFHLDDEYAFVSGPKNKNYLKETAEEELIN